MNSVYSQYTNLVNAYAEEQAAYAIKPTEASSARLRSYSQQMSNLGAAFRKEMVAKDKAQ